MITTINIEDWHALADAMREELRECAWMLSLLDSQQRYILDRNPESLFDVNASIEAQAKVIEGWQLERMADQSSICSACGAQGSKFDSLWPHVPVAQRALFEALIYEARQLQQRIQRKTRQNHNLLVRAESFGGEILQSLSPVHGVRTYSSAGRIRKSASLRGSVVRTSV